MAIVLGVNRKTIVQKILFLSKLSRQAHEQAITSANLNTSHAQFDEMQTFEHTRLKPVTIAVGVDGPSGKLLDLRAEPLSYRGPLATIALHKYGPRTDRSADAIKAAFATIKRCIISNAIITTDSHPAYPGHIRKLLPNASHRPTLRRVPIIKTDRRNIHDELFTLNYTAAKLRNDLSRMARKTWVTTKKIDRLQAHLDLYLAWNNGYRIAN